MLLGKFFVVNGQVRLEPARDRLEVFHVRLNGPVHYEVSWDSSFDLIPRLRNATTNVGHFTKIALQLRPFLAIFADGSPHNKSRANEDDNENDAEPEKLPLVSDTVGVGTCFDVAPSAGHAEHDGHCHDGGDHKWREPPVAVRQIIGRAECR